MIMLRHGDFEVLYDQLKIERSGFRCLSSKYPDDNIFIPTSSAVKHVIWQIRSKILSRLNTINRNEGLKIR